MHVRAPYNGPIMPNQPFTVLLYTGSEEVVSKSGIGAALRHQRSMLNRLNVSYTENPRDHYDIVQLNTIFPDSLHMAKQAKKDGKLVLYYAHSTTEDMRKSFIGSGLASPLFGKWLTYCYNQADLILTPTDYSKQLLEKLPVRPPILSLSNGIDTKLFARTKKKRQQFRKLYKLSDDNTVLFSVGHLIERKGILDFLEIAKAFPDYTFFWFGHTPKALLTAKVKKALRHAPSNVRFPGYVPDDVLRSAYAGSDLFLFLTYEENEGIVALEALAAEVPVLTRDIPIYKTWLPENKAVYKGRSVDEFVQKIPHILDGTLPSLTHTGKTVAKERDFQVVEKQMQDIYHQLLDK